MGDDDMVGEKTTVAVCGKSSGVAEGTQRLLEKVYKPAAGEALLAAGNNLYDGIKLLTAPSHGPLVCPVLAYGASGKLVEICD